AASIAAAASSRGASTVTRCPSASNPSTSGILKLATFQAALTVRTMCRARVISGSLRSIFPDQRAEVRAIGVLAEGSRTFRERILSDPAVRVGDLVGRSDLIALALAERAHEIAR